MVAIANKQTIHFIGDVRFISNTNGKYKTKKEVVMAHMRYIEKNAVYTSGDRNLVLRNCDIFDKRVNSRVAGKTIFALPNDIYSNSYDEWVENIKTVLSECFYVNKEYIYVAIHTEHELQDELKTYNKHAHVIFSPIDKNGKPIRTKISDLKNLHKSWDKLLEGYGYEIKRKDKEMSISEFGLGFELRKSKEKRDAYKQYLANERDREWIEKEIREILLYDEEQAR
ncbi:MAG: MobA/MobL family protein, partial [Thermoplasmata archaeon]